jgi:hypothetical protein
MTSNKNIKFKILISSIVTLLIVFLIISIYLIIYDNHERNYTYGRIEVNVEYRTSNITKEQIIETFENDKNISDFEVIDEIASFSFLNSSLSIETVDRFNLFLSFPNEKGEFRLSVYYKSESPLSENMDKIDRSKWEEKVNKQYEIDKVILDTYTFAITDFINENLNINYFNVEYEDEIYFFDE